MGGGGTSGSVGGVTVPRGFSCLARRWGIWRCLRAALIFTVIEQLRRHLLFTRPTASLSFTGFFSGSSAAGFIYRCMRQSRQIKLLHVQCEPVRIDTHDTTIHSARAPAQTPMQLLLDQDSFGQPCHNGFAKHRADRASTYHPKLSGFLLSLK